MKPNLTQPLPATYDAIDWEAPPSFLGTLSQRLTQLGQRTGPAVADSGWDLTQPAELDELPTRSRAALPGLDVREIAQPQLFERYFSLGGAPDGAPLL